MKISIVWMATALRELELLSPLLALCSSQAAPHRSHQAALRVRSIIVSHYCVLLSSSIFVTELKLKLYGIFIQCSELTGSQVITRHFYSFTVRLASIFSSASSTQTLVLACKHCNGFNFHAVHPRQPYATSLFVHSLVDPLYAKVVHFCSFVTKSNNSQINLHDTNHEQWPIFLRSLAIQFPTYSQTLLLPSDHHPK